MSDEEKEIKQKEFVRLCFIEQKKFEEIEKVLMVERKLLSLWYEEFRKEREHIAFIRRRWNPKKFDGIPFFKFYEWYNNSLHECHYCGITESEIDKLNKHGKLINKRSKTRGRSLEFDRKVSSEEYKNIDNIVLCCYWCNNAKTDTFTSEEFIAVGKEFSKIWEKRLSEILAID